MKSFQGVQQFPFLCYVYNVHNFFYGSKCVVIINEALCKIRLAILIFDVPVFLGYHPASLGNWFPMCQDNAWSKYPIISFFLYISSLENKTTTCSRSVWTQTPSNTATCPRKMDTLSATPLRNSRNSQR